MSFLQVQIKELGGNAIKDTVGIRQYVIEQLETLDVLFAWVEKFLKAIMTCPQLIIR